MDVKTAFLNGSLSENVYIFPPEGTKFKPNVVLKLKKSLYGLKQSSKCWNDEINKFLLDINFVRSDNDFCLYILTCKNEKMFLLIYVDDIILAGTNLKLLDKIKLKLMNRFKMKDKGDLKHFLGLSIHYNREEGILRIEQSMYIESVLKRFNMNKCKGSNIPIDPKLKVDLCNDNSKITDKPFRELVGCLMYLMLGSRPDICFSVNFFSRFQDKASDETWTYLKRILRYLKDNLNVGLEYHRNENNLNLWCYVNADWGGDTVDRKSTSGYVFKVFGNTLAWYTKKQTSVSLSTTEAELIALCFSVREDLWLQKLFVDLGVEFNKIVFFEDNQGCISLIRNPCNNRRVKHIDLKFQFVCDHVKTGLIHLVYIDTLNQQADVLTKGLPRPLFNKCKDMLGLREF